MASIALTWPIGTHTNLNSTACSGHNGVSPDAAFVPLFSAACCFLRIPVFLMKNTDGTMISGNYGCLLHVQTVSKPISHPDAPASPEIESQQSTYSPTLSRTIRSVFLLLPRSRNYFQLNALSFTQLAQKEKKIYPKRRQ